MSFGKQDLILLGRLSESAVKTKKLRSPPEFFN